MWVVEVWWDEEWHEVADALTVGVAWRLVCEWRAEGEIARMRWRAPQEG